jgi:hypothetical protein
MSNDSPDEKQVLVDIGHLMNWLNKTDFQPVDAAEANFTDKLWDTLNQYFEEKHGGYDYEDL